MDVAGPGAGSFLRECLVTQVTWVGLYPGIQPAASEGRGRGPRGSQLANALRRGQLGCKNPKHGLSCMTCSPLSLQQGTKTRPGSQDGTGVAKGMPPVPTLTGSTEATQFMVGKPLELLTLTGYSSWLHRKRSSPGLESPRQLADQISMFKFH